MERVAVVSLVAPTGDERIVGRLKRSRIASIVGDNGVECIGVARVEPGECIRRGLGSSRTRQRAHKANPTAVDGESVEVCCERLDFQGASACLDESIRRKIELADARRSRLDAERRWLFEHDCAIVADTASKPLLHQVVVVVAALGGRELVGVENDLGDLDSPLGVVIMSVVVGRCQKDHLPAAIPVARRDDVHAPRKIIVEIRNNGLPVKPELSHHKPLRQFPPWLEQLVGVAVSRPPGECLADDLWIGSVYQVVVFEDHEHFRDVAARFGQCQPRTRTVDRLVAGGRSGIVYKGAEVHGLFPSFRVCVERRRRIAALDCGNRPAIRITPFGNGCAARRERIFGGSVKTHPRAGNGRRNVVVAADNPHRTIVDLGDAVRPR